MLQMIVRDWKHIPAFHAQQQRRIVLEKPPRLLARAAQREDKAVIETVRALVAAA
jgi:hypothetical protein